MKCARIATATLGVAILIGPGPAPAQTRPEAEFAGRVKAGPAPEATRVGDVDVKLYRRAPPEWRFDHLSLERGAKQVLLVSHFQVDIDHARAAADGAAEGPDLIASSFTGGAQCCSIIDIVWLTPELKRQSIAIRQSGLVVETGSGGQPRLRFTDASFSGGDYRGPAVVLRLDPAARAYVADGETMRKDPPDDKTFAGIVAGLRAALAKPGADGPTALTQAMLELVYSGCAADARRLLDQAWTGDAAAKEGYWREFLDRINESTIWRRFALAKALGVEAVVPPSGANAN